MVHIQFYRLAELMIPQGYNNFVLNKHLSRLAADYSEEIYSELIRRSEEQITSYHAARNFFD